MSAYSKPSTGGPGSPTTNHGLSQQTFLSGAGVFDWHQSKLMDDIQNDRELFSIKDTNQTAYTESEICDLIVEIKES